MAEPYIRPNLAATRDGIPDAAAEVACWLNRLEDALRDAGPAVTAEAPGPQAAYDWLALAAALSRVRPELIEECFGGEELQRARAMLDGHGAELARRALSVLNPDAWLEAARDFERSLDDPLDESEEIEGAVELLEDLDEGELVLAAARRFGVADVGLEAGIERCVDWLCQHADAFLAASVYVQAVGLALRPDLESEDYELAVTALKFVHLLDAAEDAEAELTLAHVRPLPAAVVNGLYETYVEERQRLRAVFLAALALKWLPPLRRRVAGRGEEAGQVEARVWEWNSPDGQWLARLVIPDPPPRGEDELLSLAFFDAAHREAAALAGRPVVLAGVEQTIGERGRAPFELGALRASGQSPRLCVGTEQVEWELHMERPDE
jgi:hypothetical protein